MVTVEVPTQDYPEIVTNWSVIDHHVYNKMFDRKAYTLVSPTMGNCLLDFHVKFTMN